MDSGRAAAPVAAPADAGRLAAGALRLALGRGTPDDGDWPRLMVAAFVERCAPLAWRRSGGAIRAAAPSEVVAQWRARAVRADSSGRLQLEALVSVCAALGDAGCAPIVLKGLPLAQRLYGDAFVRETADGDLFVPAARRDDAAAALRALGWRHQDGEAPWEETWTRAAGAATLYLDLHSTLLDHNLAHLGALPVECEPVTIEGRLVRAHGGPLLPAYLAAHAAKHRLPPLLWFVDLATLWEKLDETAREAARRAARAARLDGYLAWALDRVAALDAAAAGEPAALARFGFGAGMRRDAHPILRDARLAAGPVDAARAVGAWAWPPPLRRDPVTFARRCAARVRSIFARHPLAEQRYDA